ncbi:ABC transporter substrate-binding protein [Shouchella clausii]|uniref:SgrR family transcriptional regulator n=1 Tax=Shouchella TaxID=2893057 RepID=UPI0004E6AA13|nr:MULTISPECIES: SgrR family transcriptional regulator [Shouchella]ALA54134.1 Oligopeptide ABC transporter, periplasmic oligopeptide-binding protein OppA [Shouchella clausii]MBU3229317.1 SgrR family transcriptional regulator [Shouchella clausii]MBU3265461.1 SgrR family transcriptional regulator [Shouchella clausii]MBU3506217.1 SgrR family transcriptional regulator [Shouchella clausii]MBU3536413.1 SgrR family transcriptional regulator [Shouchella clausii]
MELFEHYLMLAKRLNYSQARQPLSVRTLANELSCTERNAKLLVQKMQKRGWIEWRPGKGRGHVSYIRLLADYDAVVIAEAKKRASEQSLDAAIQLVQTYSRSHASSRSFIDSILNSINLEQIEQEDHLRFPTYRGVCALDPATIHRRTENHLMSHLFNQLVKYDPNNGCYIPDLAHYWETDTTNTKWTFYLRKDIFFHNGQPCTAVEVGASFLRHTEKSPYYWGIQHLHRLSALSPYTVEFCFSKPTPHFLAFAASLGGAIVYKDEMTSFPIGTGPFSLSDHSSKRLRLQAFPRYFSTRPHLDAVTMYIFPALYDNEPETAFLAANQLNFYHYPYVEKEEHHFQQQHSMDIGCKLLSLNKKHGLCANDTRLREALFHFLDPHSMIQDIGGTRSIPADRVFAQGQSVLTTRNRLKGQASLLKSNYHGEELQLYSYTGAGNERDAGWIEQTLKAEGISVRLHLLPYHELQQLDLEQKADLLLGEQLGYDDKVYGYFSLFFDRHRFLYSHVGTDDLEKAKRLWHQELKTETLLASLQTIETSLCQAHYLLPLYRLKQFALYPEYVKNVALNAYGWVDYTTIWLKRGKS